MANLEEVSYLPMDAVVKIEVSGEYYSAFQKAYAFFVQQQNAQHGTVLEDIEQLKTGTPKTPFQAHVLTLSTFMYSVEESAKEQNIIKKTMVDFDNLEGTPEN